MYLLSVPLLISDDAVFITAFIAILNVSGLVLCYILVRRYISRTAALIAVGLYAVNPWQVLFSRKIWTQNTLVPFVLVFLILLFESVFCKRPKLLITTIGVLALTIQLHLSALFLVPFTVLFLMHHRNRINYKYLLAGTLAGIFLTLPYIVFNITNDYLTISRFFKQVAAPFTVQVRGITLPISLITTKGFEYSLGSSYDQFIKTVLTIPALDYALMILCLIGLWFAFRHGLATARALDLYTFIALAYAVFNKAYLHPHYFNALLPVLIIFCSLPFAVIIEYGRRPWKWLSAVSLSVVLMYQLAFSIRFLTFIHSSDCILGDYGPPYRARVEIVKRTVEDIRSEGGDLEFDTILERSRSCGKWDPLATQYVLERLEVILDH
jgi:hypothetical protein